MINLINLVNTTLIALGTGASTLNTPKPRYNAPNQYTDYTITTQQTNNVNEWVNNISNGNVWNYSFGGYDVSQQNNGYLRKQNAYGNTQSMTVNQTNYIDNIYMVNPIDTNTNRERYVYKTNYTTLGTTDYTNIMMVYQISPNNLNINNEITLNTYLHVNIDADGVLDQIIGFAYTGQIKVKVDTYTTTDNWSSLVNLTNYARPNLDIFNDLMQYQYNFTHRQQEYTTYAHWIQDPNTPDDDIQEQVVEISQGITITATKTNYVVMIITPEIQLQYSPLADKDPEGNVAVYGTQNKYGNIYTSDAVITGTMIVNTNTQEVIDLPGLMFDVLTMPFTFISIAFNVTLFPGTPYQLNISNLFLTIIAILVFVFLIKLLIQLKAGA